MVTENVRFAMAGVYKICWRLLLVLYLVWPISDGVLFLFILFCTKIFVFDVHMFTTSSLWSCSGVFTGSNQKTTNLRTVLTGPGTAQRSSRRPEI